jgi:hypothetical protein
MRGARLPARREKEVFTTENIEGKEFQKRVLPKNRDAAIYSQVFSAPSMFSSP